MVFQEVLKERLLKILTNPDEVEDALVAQIAQEATELVGERVLAQPFVLDIAIYRYLLIKGTLSLEGFEQAYKEAIRRLSVAPVSPAADDPDGSPDFGIAVGQRGAAWI